MELVSIKAINTETAQVFRGSSGEIFVLIEDWDIYMLLEVDSKDICNQFYQPLINHEYFETKEEAHLYIHDRLKSYCA